MFGQALVVVLKSLEGYRFAQLLSRASVRIQIVGILGPHEVVRLVLSVFSCLVVVQRFDVAVGQLDWRLGTHLGG